MAASPPPPVDPHAGGGQVSVAQLVEVLEAALDPNPSRRQPAEALLQGWEPMSAYPSSLQAVVTDQSVGTNPRWLAAVCLKNCVTRWWRKRLNGGLVDEEKSSLRASLLSSVGEPHLPIAKQVALTIAKIARNDWPEQWPDLLPSLMTSIQGGDDMKRTRALLVLHVVIKELSAKVVGPVRRHLQQAAPQVFSFLLQLWMAASPLALENLAAAETELSTLKILRRLLVYGFSRIDLSQDASTFLQHGLVCLQNRAHLPAPPQDPSSPLHFATRSALKIAQSVNDVQHASPLSFSPFLGPFLQFALQWMQHWPSINGHAGNSDESQRSDFVERLTIRCILFVTNVMACPQYQARWTKRTVTTEASSAQPLPTPQAAAECLDQILTADAVRHLATLIVSHYLILRTDDLRDWASDPESFVNADLNEEGLRVRPTAENLFSTLMQHRKETISQVTLQMLEQVTQTATDATDEALLLRESVYLAIGLCSYDLQETLNFGAWFTGPLAASLRPPEPVPKLHRVIRRRIAALMAAFVDSLREATIRDAAYQTAVALLSDSDFVVRVTASDAILHLIDDTAFFPANFRPHLEGAVGGLFRLLYDAAEVDTKLRILNVISVLMESMGPKVRPVVANVVQAVPELWEQAKEQNLMKGAVLVTITRLVQALGAEVVSIVDFVTGVVEFSADVVADHELYTLEDGLNLWLAILRGLAAPHPPLLALYPNCVRVIERDFEFLQICMHITESQILLTGKGMVETYGAELVRLFSAVLGQVKDAAHLMLLEVIDTLITACPVEGGRLLDSSQLTFRMLAMAYGGGEGSLVTSSILTTLARQCANDPDYFKDLLDRAASAGVSAEVAATPGGLLGGFIDLCVENVDHLMLPSKRKVIAVGLANLIPTNNEEILKRVGGILNVVVEVLHQERKDDVLCGVGAGDGGPGILGGGFREVLAKQAGVEDDALGGLADGGDQECQSARRRALEESDAVQSVDLAMYLQHKLAQCQAGNGDAVYNQVMASVDQDLLLQLKHACAVQQQQQQQQPAVGS